MGHVVNDSLYLTGTQVYGGHRSMAIFNGICDLLVNVTLPETGVPEIYGGRVEHGCDRALAVAIASVTRGALFFIKRLSVLSHCRACGYEEGQPQEYTNHDVNQKLTHNIPPAYDPWFPSLALLAQICLMLYAFLGS
jgi:hypothetical protein